MEVGRWSVRHWQERDTDRGWVQPRRQSFSATRARNRLGIWCVGGSFRPGGEAGSCWWQHLSWSAIWNSTRSVDLMHLNLKFTTT
jgi:hypothetical protein